MMVTGLKPKEPRLRDWNEHCEHEGGHVNINLETKRTSITRSKLGLVCEFEALSCDTWNQKNLDYEIETFPAPRPIRVRKSLEIKRTSITRLKLIISVTVQSHINAWNQKNLDCEMETCPVIVDCDLGHLLPWNQKNLDCEMETWVRVLLYGSLLALEIKRTSITRLKLRFYTSKPKRITSWNQKNLDYEIETRSIFCQIRCKYTWNQKNLDYEIETAA